MKLTMVDLGCGLGGASAAMRDRGWRVIGVDRDPAVAPEITCDIRELRRRNLRIDLLWASTECVQFTRAALPWKNRGKLFEPDLSVELAVKRLVETWRPRWWLVENTIHARKYLTPIFGPVRARIAGHFLWGNLPLLLPEVRAFKEKMGPLESDRARYLARSLIPYEISLAIALQVERSSSERSGPQLQFTFNRERNKKLTSGKTPAHRPENNYAARRGSRPVRA